MNNAIKALEEELERHKNQKEVHESAAHNSKVDWNRCSRECKQLRKQIKEKEKTLETMKGTKDITLEIGVPNFFYSDGSTIANLVSSNIIMVKHLNLRKGGFTPLNDDDMKLLADSLPNNTYLKLIDLDGSKITKVGHLAILRALFNVSSLNACVTSNHSCRLKLGRYTIVVMIAIATLTVKI